jgi:hypothetical protein
MMMILVAFALHFVSAQQCLSTLTDNRGLISYPSDGSISYGNNVECIWVLQPAGTYSQIVIVFDSFDLESDADFLFIYSGVSTSQGYLEAFSGNTIPPNVTISSTCTSLSLCTH